MGDHRLAAVGAADVAVERVMDQELVAQDPVDGPGVAQRVLPRGPGVGRVGLEARELLARLLELLVELGELGEVRVGRRGDERRRVEVLERLRAEAAQVAAFGDVVEVGVDLVELLLRDRVELVVVAAGAPQGQPHPHRAGRRHAIYHVLDQELLGDDAALAVLAVVAVEGGGDLLLQGRVGEHVAGDLLDGELIERHVVVVGVDHPVAVAPHLPRGVGLIPARVGVAGPVQPLGGHPLAVSLRLEHAVDVPLESVGRVVAENRGDIAVRRREPGQIERDAAEQREDVGLRRGLLACPLEPRLDEVVDGVADPLGAGHRRYRRPLGRDERPVRLPLGPLIDPQPQGLDLAGVEGVLVRARHDRGVQAQPVGHPHPGVGGADPVDQQALVGVAGRDDRPAELAAIREGPFRHVQPQAALARLRVRPVAGEAVLGQDRPDLAGEVHGPLRDRRHVGVGQRGSHLRAAVDPLPDEVDLLVAQRHAGRRHLPDGILGGQPLVQHARFRVARHDDPIEELVGVEPQVGLPDGVVGPVAEQARLGENRPDVTVELERLRLLRRRRRDIDGEVPAKPDREHDERSQSAESCLRHGHSLKHRMV